MANTPSNIYLDRIVGPVLTTIAETEKSSRAYAEIWMTIYNNETAVNTFSIYQNNGTDDILIVKKKIQSGRSWVVDELTGSKLSIGQSIKVSGDSAASDYNVNLSAAIIDY